MLSEEGNWRIPNRVEFVYLCPGKPLQRRWNSWGNPPSSSEMAETNLFRASFWARPLRIPQPAHHEQAVRVGAFRTTPQEQSSKLELSTFCFSDLEVRVTLFFSKQIYSNLTCMYIQNPAGGGSGLGTFLAAVRYCYSADRMDGDETRCSTHV